MKMTNQVLDEAQAIYETARDTYYAYRKDGSVSDARLQRAEKEMISAYNHLEEMRLIERMKTQPIADI
jgi:hypothetical protein